MDIEKHKRNLIRFLKRDVIEKKKILPEGWDTGLTDKERADLDIDFDRDTEEWKCQEIIDFLKDVFIRDEGLGTNVSMEATDKILRKIAYSKNLNRMEIDRILGLIVKESGLEVKVGTLNRQINEIKKTAWRGQTIRKLLKPFCATWQIYLSSPSIKATFGSSTEATGKSSRTHGSYATSAKTTVCMRQPSVMVT